MSLWPNGHHHHAALSYKQIIKQLASQAPKIYGDIPPPKYARHHKKKQRTAQKAAKVADNDQKVVANERHMSHVENWVLVDSKERLPDEQDLARPSNLRNYLTLDFLSEVLPLHTPPMSLSDPLSAIEQDQMAALADHLKETRLPLRSEGSEGSEDGGDVLRAAPAKNETAQEAVTTNKRTPTLVRRHSITSTSYSQLPSIQLSLDASSNHNRDAMARPNGTNGTNGVGTDKTDASQGQNTPMVDNNHTNTNISSTSSANSLLQQVRWLQTVQRLRHSLVRFGKRTTPTRRLPFPPPPAKSAASTRRRSEATTQPRYNPDTNTYTRDTRANPDHLRMIAAELNMMRHRKLISPLRPRGFLPRRKDVVYLGDARRRSPLIHEFS
ncbi:hypothetical protein BC940DRAFT_371748 [Gongronella butleri]|nr:hypothetical protein BC940DRAFT_371748 [Gongronella butleri]